jgi:phosphoenolpyruvate synthase/pyruvate phosphate dikinase
MRTLWLGDLESRDRSLVGGKVANLSRLAAAYDVPGGYCLPTTAFIAPRLMDNTTSEALRLPAVLKEAVANAYEQLSARCGATPAVAVRSSAVDEDGGAASFAGQYETFLNISGADAIIKAIERCWESAYTDRALEYRRRQGFSTEQVSLAVLVQRLVPADVSAVIFSANPITGNRGEVVINASWGLGESIVGGTVTPDTITVGKVDHVVRSRLIAEKRRMTVAVPGGTREVDVPRLLRSRPALTDTQIEAMAALAASLETTMGWPVDVECAFHDDRLYLLQCRPITTLALSPVAQDEGKVTALAGM